VNSAARGAFTASDFRAVTMESNSIRPGQICSAAQWPAEHRQAHSAWHGHARRPR
jgi:hypothetical protein